LKEDLWDRSSNRKRTLLEVVIQYDSVPADVTSDKCTACLGDGTKDKLEMIITGLENVEFGNKKSKSCLEGVLVGHAGDPGLPELLTDNKAACVALNNPL